MNYFLSNAKITIFVLLIAQFAYFNLAAQNFVWERTNPGCGGSFSAAKVGPSGHIVACSDLGGAYYSTDFGDSWGVYGPNVGINQTHFSSLGFDFRNENIFFIGTEDGIYRTNDKGDSFSKVLPNGYIEDIVVAPSNSNVVYAAYHPVYDSSNGKVYKSTNNGINWSLVSTNLPNGLRILKLLVNPNDASQLYLLSGKGDFACTDAEVYRSDNGGVNWKHLTDNLNTVLDIALKPNEPGKVYLTTQNADCEKPYYWTDTDGKFYVSDNNGDSWTEQSARTGIIWVKANDEIILIDPRVPYHWVETNGTWLSTNEGVSWSQVSKVSDSYEKGYITADNWAYGVSDNGICKTIGTSQRATDDIAVWVHTRFVYISTDAGASFKQAFTNGSGGKWQSRGIDNVVMNDLEINKKDPNIMYAGYFDIGFWRSFDQGQSWQPSNPVSYTGGWDGNGGNALTILSDPDRENVVWTAMKGDFADNAFLLKSEDYGEVSSWVLQQNGLPGSPYIHNLILDRNSSQNSRTLYVSSGGDIYKGVNDGQNWSRIFENGGMRVVELDFFDSNKIYAGGELGFHRSMDGGENWENTGLSNFTGNENDSFENDEWEGVIDIYADRQTRGLLYVAVHGNGKGLYESRDYGETWTKILDDNHARCITANPNNNRQLFFGSSSAYKNGGFESNSNGILYSENQGADWTNINSNSVYPFAFTVDVTKQTDNQKVFVGSPGTGFQYADVPQFSNVLGDVNCDGVTNAVDALFVLQYVAGVKTGTDSCPIDSDMEIFEPNADVNRNGNIDAVDALFILQCTVGIPNVLCP